MSILLPQRPPQENLLQHTFDLYGDDIVDGVVPSSVGDKSRLPNTGRGYNITDPTSLLRFTDLTGITITAFEGTTTPTINGNDIEFTTGILYSLTLSNGAFFNCEDTGLIAFNSAFAGFNATKINTDVLGANTFSYEGDDVPRSYQNKIGFSARGSYVDSISGGIRLATRFRNSFLRNDDWEINFEVFIGNQYILGKSYTLFSVTPTDGARFQITYSVGGGTSDIVISFARRNLTNDGNDVNISLQLLNSELSSFEEDLHKITIKNFNNSLTATFDGIELTNDEITNYSSGGGNSTVYLGANQASLNFTIGSTFVKCNINGEELNPLNNWGGAISNGTAYYIPRDEANPKFDVLGNPLQYKGQVSYPAKLVQSNCLSFDGVDDLLRFTDLTGVTITSYQGTATPTISGNDITCTAGTLFNLLLSDGTHLPCAEGGGNTVFDSSGNNNHGTLINGVSWGKQDMYHYNWKYGFKVNRVFADATTLTISTKVGNPVLGFASTRRSEVQFDFTILPSAIFPNDFGINLGDGRVEIRSTQITIRTSALVNNSVTIPTPLQTNIKYFLKIIDDFGNWSIYLDNQLLGQFVDNGNGSIRFIQSLSTSKFATGLIVHRLQTIDSVVAEDNNTYLPNKYWQYESENGIELISNGANSIGALVPINHTYLFELPDYIDTYKPSQRNHNGAETKVDFNPYGAPELSSLNTPYAINDSYRNQLNQFKRDSSDILFYKEDLTGNKLNRAKNYTKEI